MEFLNRNKIKSILLILIMKVMFLSSLAFMQKVDGDDLSELNSEFKQAEQKSPLRNRITTALALENHIFLIDPAADTQTQTFEAEFILLNKSGSAIELDMISSCGEDKPVQFKLKNSNEETLWEYIVVNPLLGCPAFLEEFTLQNNESIRHSVEVPLVINGETLQSGEYLLEAFLDGRPQFGAFANIMIE